MDMRFKPANKMLLKIIGLAYLAFVVLLFVQHFLGRELYPLPQIRVEEVDLTRADAKDITARKVLPAAVLEPQDMLWYRFRAPFKSEQDVEEVKKKGVRRILVFPPEAQKSALSVTKLSMRLTQSIPIVHNKNTITSLPAGIILDYRELALLIYGGYAGKKIPVAGKGSLMDINATAGFVILNFLILVVLLHGFLWDPLMRVLDERARRVQEDLNTARLERQKAEELRQRYENALAQAHIEADDIKYRKLKEAATQGEKLLAKAREDAHRIIEDARKQVKAEYLEAQKRLRREVAELAVSIAKKILEREIDEEEHHKLVARFIKEMGDDKE